MLELCFEIVFKEEEVKRIEWGCFERLIVVEWLILLKEIIRVREGFYVLVFVFLLFIVLSIIEKEMEGF